LHSTVHNYQQKLSAALDLTGQSASNSTASLTGSIKCRTTRLLLSSLQLEVVASCWPPP
jgi:hypothetical protein